jgi:hypothetical protein
MYLQLGGMFVFALLIPETKGRSLEEMDIIFGSVTREQREIDIQKALAGKQQGQQQQQQDATSVKSDHEKKSDTKSGEDSPA